MAKARLMIKFYWQDPFHKGENMIPYLHSERNGDVYVGYARVVGDYGSVWKPWPEWVKWAKLILEKLPDAKPNEGFFTDGLHYTAKPMWSPPWSDALGFLVNPDGSWVHVGNSGWTSTSATKESWLDAARKILESEPPTIVVE